MQAQTQKESSGKQEVDYHKKTHVRTKAQQWVGHYGKTTPTNTNRDTQKTIHMPKPGGSDIVTPKPRIKWYQQRKKRRQPMYYKGTKPERQSWQSIVNPRLDQ